VLNINPFSRGRKEPERRVVVPFAPRPRRDRSAADLARIIEGEIIPRLLLTQEARAAVAPSLRELESRGAMVDGLARRTIEEDLPPLLADALGRIESGDTFEGLCFELFAPAARRLGDWWLEDRITFTDVTVGLCRLQQLVHELSDRFAPHDPGPDAPSILLAAAPGEQHVFGLTLMGEVFRRGGWRVSLVQEATAGELIDMVRTEVFAVIALSLTDERFYPETLKLAPKLRRGSANPGAVLMVGGPAFSEAPARISEIGADLSAATAQEALHAADRRIGRRAALA
jgi:methanogenic corrinoid protein MtbC1